MDTAIRQVELFLLRDENAFRPKWSQDWGEPYLSPILCRLTTRDGAQGVAALNSYSENRFDPYLYERAQTMARHLIGRSALDRGAIHKLLSSRIAPNTSTLSLFDNALWDYMGKRAGLPVYQMLGACRDKIKSYASTPTFDTVEAYYPYLESTMEVGFGAFKLHVFGDLENDLRLVRQVSARYGDRARFMIDIECKYNRQEAMVMCKELENLNWVWVEAPLPDADFTGYRYLRQHSTVPIISSGNMVASSSMENLMTAVREGAYTALRTDAGSIGGITNLKKIVALAEINHMNVEIQSWGITLCQATNLHVMLSCDNCGYFEQAYPYENNEMGAKTLIRTDKDGYVHAPKGPGLGVEMDWQEVERLTVCRYCAR